MALRFADSWSRYGPDSVPNKLFLTDYWTAAGGITNIITGDTVRGNFAGFGIELVSGFLNNGTLSKTLTHKSGWTVGCRIYFGQGGGLIQAASLINGYHVDRVLVTAQLNVDGTFSINLNGNVIATSGFAAHAGRKYYVELGYTVGGGTPVSVTATIRVNGVSVVTGTGSTGLNVSQLLLQTATTNRHTIVGPGSASSHVFSDLYIVDSDNTVIVNGNPQTTALNTFLGDIKIQAIFPASDTATIAWTPNPGPAHWNMLNEVPPDEDTTYVATAAIGNQDIYGWQPIPGFTGTLKGVVLSFRARKDDEGTKQFQQVIGSTGAEQQSDTFSVGDEYIYWHYAYDLDPATLLPWTQAGFNAKKFGVKLIA